MFSLAKRSVGLACFIIVLFLASVASPAFGGAATPSSFSANLFSDSVTITKLPDTTTDVAQGIRCTNMTVQVMRSIFNTLIAQPETHCMVLTAAGLIDKNSSVIQPVGMAKAYPLVINHGGQPLIIPIQGSASALLATNDTATPGLNVGIYNDLFTHLKFNGNPLNMSYTLVGEPDIYLHFPNGNKMTANLLGSTLSFSSDGRYMVIDGVFQGFERYDFMTQQTVTFADDLMRANDTSLLSAATAISASGRYAAVAYSAPGGWGSKYLKVIDINSCAGSISSCKMVDVYSQLKTAVPTIGTIDRVDFSSENSLLVTARYDFDGHTSKEGQFVITPVGQSGSREEYLAMGDSYISGEGAGDYLLGTDTSDNKCHQSLISYPYLIGKKLNSIASVACSGAVMLNIQGTNDATRYAQVENRSVITEADKVAAYELHMPGILKQIDFVSKDNPQIVTLSVGGNDVGFVDIVTKCVSPLHSLSDGQTCYGTYSERRALLNQIDGQFNNLVTTYQQLKANAPARRVYIIGYPQIIAFQTSCALNVHLNDVERQFAAQLIDYLDGVIEKAATKAGVYYVDTRHVFDGHRLCDSGEKAVNGLTKGNDKSFIIANESYHPNAYGNELLADFIAKATNNLTNPMPASQNVANPQADDSLPILQAVTNTHQQIYEIQNVNTTTEELLFAGNNYTIPATSSPANLAPNTSFDAVLHSDPIHLGTLFTNAAGILVGTLRIPTGTPPGFHTLHYYGTNIAGEPVDIQDVVYVAATQNDYDGDKISNTDDSCPAVPNSNVDADQDGIDDACDGMIGPAPTSPSSTNAETPTSATTLTLTNVQNALPFNTAATVLASGATVSASSEPHVLHAQEFVAKAKQPQFARIFKASNTLLAGAAAASLVLIVGIIFFLLRLRTR